LGNSFFTAAVLYELAETYRLLGQPEEAIEFARQSLKLSREIGDVFWAASSLVNTGVIAFYTGNFAEAGGYLREANAIYREMDNKAGIATSNVILSRLAFLEGDLDEDDALTEEALGIATEIGNKRVAEAARNLPGFVALMLGEKVEESRETELPVPVAEVPGRLGRYELKKLLGFGGYSAVYLAYDPDSDRDVAIRETHQRVLRQYAWARENLRREAEFHTKLAHRGLIECYDYVETADHTYLVLEFIPGKHLEGMLDERVGFPPERDVIQWGIQICDALIYLHNQRPEPIILRDLKPSNVMVRPDGSIVLIDLSITETYQRGREMAMLGTEGYAPPEQYVGYTDARSDVYSLGAVLHYLLTRRDPRTEKPFTFHDAPPRSLHPAISEQLEAVVLKAVEYKILDRYQSVEEMRAALLACLD
jgi:tetratricopeptide (TPR) repeat protein